MGVPRLPLNEEPIDGAATVANYDRYARRFMGPEYRLMVRKILRSRITGGRVLDVGTGSGRLAAALAEAKNSRFDIVALDISAGMLKRACSNLRPASIKKVSFVQATAAQMPFQDETFDVVMSYASLHHWHQPAAVLNEIWRVTKKNGLILIRDNRRMLGHPFYKSCIWVLSRLMTREQREMWPKSILASYTLEEAQALLAQCKIGQATVCSDMGGFDVCIESRK